MLFARGAEAVIKKEGGAIVKERVAKGYRLPQLDAQLRRKRARSEARLLREARRAGVAVPVVVEEKDVSITIEYIDGKKVKDVLGEENCSTLCAAIAASVATLHAAHIVHGDLTTSNMILKGDVLYLIDFGLGFISQRAEDKANDLYVLREALEATHFPVFVEAWDIILNTYSAKYPEVAAVMRQLKKIEKRRRYKGAE